MIAGRRDERQMNTVARPVPQGANPRLRTLLAGRRGNHRIEAG